MNLVARHNTEVTALCRRFGVRRLEVFGSVATGQDDPTESDVDFLVEFETLPDGTTQTRTLACSRASRRCFSGPSI